MMLTLPSTLTHREARDALSVLSQTLRLALHQADPAAQVLVDASALQQFDSSALAVLLECQRLAKAAGSELVLSSAPLKLKDLARLYGVEGLLTLEPEPSSAPV